MSRTRNAFVTLSLIAHGALAFAVGEIRTAKSYEVTAIQVAETKQPKKPEPAKVDPKPEPEEKRPRVSANRKPAPLPERVPEAPAPQAAPAMDALPDFGVSLSGGVQGTGMALPVGSPTAARKPQASRSLKRLAAAAPALAGGGCDEPLVKPKPRNVPQPSYTAEARAAAVEGRVRVQLTVDETGRVTNVRILAGLGHGLDEAALAAARQASFEPATRCGKPSSATFTISMRFTL
jgi:protein TonB